MNAKLACRLLGACNPLHRSLAAPHRRPPRSRTATRDSAAADGARPDRRNGVRKARDELETSNIDIDGHGIDPDRRRPPRRRSATPNLLSAQITPQGDLLIEGKAVPVTPAAACDAARLPPADHRRRRSRHDDRRQGRGPRRQGGAGSARKRASRQGRGPASAWRPKARSSRPRQADVRAIPADAATRSSGWRRRCPRSSRTRR